jgi:environmental stress-induced protein Ves
MQWKNRLGETAEIEIFPETSDFSNGDFVWRLSSAQIKSANQFSNFEGYDRILFVCQGEGLLINDFKLELLQPYGPTDLEFLPVDSTQSVTCIHFVIKFLSQS